MTTRVVRSDMPTIAYAISLFWFKRIYIGTLFDRLPSDVQAAVIQHEEGHCANHHLEKRLLFLVFMPFLYKWICHKQEIEADRCAVAKGLAEPLLRLLAVVDGAENLTTPSAAKRREMIALALAPSRSNSIGAA